MPDILETYPELNTMFDWHSGGGSPLYSLASRMLSGEEMGDRFHYIDLKKQGEIDLVKTAIADLKHDRLVVEVNSEIYSKDGDVPTMLNNLDVAIAYLAKLIPVKVSYTAEVSNPDPLWRENLSHAPVLGLRVEYRLYQCQIKDCGAVVKIQTNHTASCFNWCVACAWRSGYDRNGVYYTAMNKERPVLYVGEVGSAENTH